MARFCEKHMKRAVDTLTSKRFGVEYDLCSICQAELSEILNGIPVITENEPQDHKTEVNSGRKRTPGRPKAIKG